MKLYCFRMHVALIAEMWSALSGNAAFENLNRLKIQIPGESIAATPEVELFRAASTRI
jgi:hypothetical protein